MPRYLIILSSVPIAHNDFLAFLLKEGATTASEPHAYYDAEMVRYDSRILIAMDNGQLEDYDVEDPEVLEKLGGEPQTLMTIEFRDDARGERAAFQVAHALARRWPCVVDNLSGAILSEQDLLSLIDGGQHE